MRETLTLLTCADNSIVSKKSKQNIWVPFGTHLCFEGSTWGRSGTEHGDNQWVQFGTTPNFLRLQAETIHEVNPEHLFVLEAQHGDDPIHESNPKHLIVFKAPCGDDPRVQHLPHREDPRVQSRTTLCLKVPCGDDTQGGGGGDSGKWDAWKLIMGFQGKWEASK